ncbi:prolyl oligopeptidase family serine peptidase [Actinoalloteichus fjordicus]|uniref:prolyl oligopeptidase n=1 Tax=Actinoalloteichus fjordicus TaxID=1612552 RepID=A0AAC9PS96_9PSEU|nr:prolyl oligopeptidase family serine peptidase [Actinoalloteichus fjordicus]APU14616.1 serine protease, S9A family peptidase [Actinoalloteichus fjordicus]
MNAYPPAPRGTEVDVLHGRVVPDPYRSLEHETGDTVEWTAAQGRLVDAYFRDCRVRRRFADRLEESDVRPEPTSMRFGDREFLPPSGDGADGGLRMRRADGSVVTVCDPREIDPVGHPVLDRFAPSPDGRVVACQLSRRGVEYGAILVIDADTGTILDGPVGPTRYSSIAWLPDCSAFFYVSQEPASVASAGTRPVVALHRLDSRRAARPARGAGLAAREPTSQAGGLDAVRVPENSGATRPGVETPITAEPDVVPAGLLAAITVATEGAAAISLRIDRGRWLLLHCGSAAGGGNRVWLADLADPTAFADPVRPLIRCVTEGIDARTHAEIGPDGLLYLLTTHRAPNRRLCRVEPADPHPEHWREVVPALPDATLASVTLLEGTPVLLVLRLLGGAHEAALHDRATGRRLRTITLPGPGRVGQIVETGHREVRFVYTDFVTPPTRLRCDLVTGFCLAITRQASRPSPATAVRQVRYRSADGTPVRLFLLGRTADLAVRPRSPLPTLLTAYGGFGIPTVPAYDPELLAWVAEGGLVAIACVRGGGDEGAAWHRAGRSERKQNTFDDLHAAAEWLIADGHTSPDRLGLLGSSNGGLLVGTAITQRPDLFAAGVARGAVLDMIRSEQFGLGPLWRGEYGSVRDESQFLALLAYSPYHRVRPGIGYPATLFVVADGDTRVHPMHARKTCAAMQHADPAGRPVLLRALPDAGHVEHSRHRAAAVAAETLAFLARETGLLGAAGFAEAAGPVRGAGSSGETGLAASPSGRPPRRAGAHQDSSTGLPSRSSHRNTRRETP